MLPVLLDPNLYQPVTRIGFELFVVLFVFVTCARSIKIAVVILSVIFGVSGTFFLEQICGQNGINNNGYALAAVLHDLYVIFTGRSGVSQCARISLTLYLRVNCLQRKCAKAGSVSPCQRGYVEVSARIDCMLIQMSDV